MIKLPFANAETEKLYHINYSRNRRIKMGAKPHVKAQISPDVVCSCGSRDLYTAGFIHSKQLNLDRRYYKCKKCQKRFVFPKIAKPAKPKPPKITKITKPKLPTINLLCPSCSSNKIRRNGFNHNKLLKRLLCNNCNRNFYVSLDETQIVVPERKLARNPSHTPKIPETKVTIEPSLRALIEKRILWKFANNLTETPCFCCPLQEQQECDPVTCEKLSSYLGCPNIHKYLRVYDEHPLPDNPFFDYTHLLKPFENRKLPDEPEEAPTEESTEEPDSDLPDLPEGEGD